MVLLTAYLYEGFPPGTDDSEISERKIEFYEMDVRAEHWMQKLYTNNDRCVPRLSLRVLVEFGASQCTLAGLSTHSVRVIIKWDVVWNDIRRSRSASGVCTKLAAGKLAPNQHAQVLVSLHRTGVADEVAMISDILLTGVAMTSSTCEIQVSEEKVCIEALLQLIQIALPCLVWGNCCSSCFGERPVPWLPCEATRLESGKPRRYAGRGNVPLSRSWR